MIGVLGVDKRKVVIDLVCRGAAPYGVLATQAVSIGLLTVRAIFNFVLLVEAVQKCFGGLRRKSRFGSGHDDDSIPPCFVRVPARATPLF